MRWDSGESFYRLNVLLFSLQWGHKWCPVVLSGERPSCNKSCVFDVKMLWGELRAASHPCRRLPACLPVCLFVPVCRARVGEQPLQTVHALPCLTYVLLCVISTLWWEMCSVHRQRWRGKAATRWFGAVQALYFMSWTVYSFIHSFSLQFSRRDGRTGSVCDVTLETVQPPVSTRA